MKRQFEDTIQKPAVVCLLALAACALWGSAFPSIKLSYQWLTVEGASSQILLAGYRFTLAGALTYLIACISRKKLATIPKNAVSGTLLLGLCQTTLQYVFFYIGMAHTTGVKGSVINSANVFAAIIVARFALKDEPLTARKIIGCLIGFFGIIVINFSPGSMNFDFAWNGEGFMLASTIVYGASAVLLKIVAAKGDSVTINALQLLFGGVLLLVIGLISGGRVTGFEPKSVALLLYMSVLSAVAFTIWTVLMKYNPVGKVAVYGFSIPVFGSALSGIFLGEKVLTLRNLIALLFVSAGIVIVNYAGRKSEMA